MQALFLIFLALIHAANMVLVLYDKRLRRDLNSAAAPMLLPDDEYFF